MDSIPITCTDVMVIRLYALTIGETDVSHRTNCPLRKARRPRSLSVRKTNMNLEIVSVMLETFTITGTVDTAMTGNMKTNRRRRENETNLLVASQTPSQIRIHLYRQ